MTVSLLVVDDSSSFRALVLTHVEGREDIAVVGEAADGEEAIDLASRLRPAAVLLDCHMPVTDGIDALPRLRRAAPDAWIVMYSSSDDGDARRRALEEGADAYQPKTDAVDDVLDAVVHAVADR